MPMTFFSHQAVVLPLKIAAPRWTSGTALVLGSMAPDVEYMLRGYPSSAVSHSWLGQITFCLPVTIVLFWLVTRIIARAAAQYLPRDGLFSADYALLALQPSGARHWATVATSALIGSSSHVLLDDATDVLGLKPYHDLNASAWWIAVNVAAWIGLAWVTVVLLQHIARHRLLRRWAAGRASSADIARVMGGTVHPVAPADPSYATTEVSPERAHRGDTRWPPGAGAFWGWVALSVVIGAVLGIIFRRRGFFLNQGATWVHIWLCSVSGGFIGLLTASATWHARTPGMLDLRGGEE